MCGCAKFNLEGHRILMRCHIIVEGEHRIAPIHNTRRNKVVISLHGWSIVGDELSHIICKNEVTNEQ